VRVVFLDVDGVLNSKVTREKETLNENQTAGIDAGLLENIGKVLKETKAKVVVSSTWREEPEKLQELTNALESQGGEIIGVTANLEGRGDRVDEIRKWLMDNISLMVEKWIVIDDLDLSRMNPALQSDHFVHTDDNIGLDATMTTEAINKLNGIGMHQ